MFPRRQSMSNIGNAMSQSVARTLLNLGRKRRRVSSDNYSGASSYLARGRRRPSSLSVASSRRFTYSRKNSKSGVGHNATVTKGKKKLKIRGRKKVKVSPKLKTAIKQVTDSEKVRGYYQDNRIDILEPGLVAGRMAVEKVPTRTANAAGYLFQYDRVLHAASRLWNRKVANLNPDILDADNFAPRDTVIEVVKQWWSFVVKNNSMRRVRYVIYKCQKKNSSIASDAYAAWNNGLTTMQSDGQLVSDPDIGLMHAGPTISNQFRTAWRAEEIKVTLDPGEEYQFSVSGPSMTYRGQDFYDNVTYKPVQKQDVQLIWASYGDIVGTHTGGVTGNAGHAPDTTVDEPTQERTYVESTYHCHIAMPEKVGGVTTAVGALFQNINRVRRTCIDDFQPRVFGTDIHRRDQENPVIESV